MEEKSPRPAPRKKKHSYCIFVTITLLDYLFLFLWALYNPFFVIVQYIPTFDRSLQNHGKRQQCRTT